jgi:crossover junction endodeoxyribonuclease RuvC
MFDSKVLGIDPGTGSIGLAVVRRGTARPEVAWAATLSTPAGAHTEERLHRIHAVVEEALAEHRPQALAIERLLWGRNSGSAMQVARASGVVMLAAAQAAVPVYEYAPLEVKMAVTGSGNASKEQVRRGLGLVIGAGHVPRQPDAADAIAIALCHLQQSPLRRLERAGAST